MRLAFLSAASVLMLVSSAHAQTAVDIRALPAIAVTGEGIAAVVPDIAIVTSGVVTRAETAGAALAANSAAMTKVLETVRGAKVADRDVATSGLSIQPQYDYGDGSGRQRAPRLTGYEVRNAVTIRARDLDGLGALVDRLVGSGSNQIEGLSFDVADREKHLDQARKAAIADARRKAELYAESAGVKLGAVVSVDETVEVSPGPQPFAMRAKAADAAPTPIARGEQELSAKVSVRWAIAP